MCGSIKDYLGKTVIIKIDRPVGYVHHGYVYPVNYGYIPNTVAGDGEEQDVYLLGVTEPIEEYTCTVIAIVHRRDDEEDKFVAAPEGMRFTEDEIAKAVHFQERFFDSEIIM